MRTLCLSILLVATGCSRERVRGELVDYATGKPIAAATVTVRSRGWGISSSQLVWDKTYSASASTDAEGKFTLPVPGPQLLTFGGTTLSAKATGYHRLSDIGASESGPLLLQAVRSVPRAERVPGGTAYIGITESGRPFGWIFAENRPTLDVRRADIFALDSGGASARTMTLATGALGGLLFLSREQQRIATASYGMFLRYADVAPPVGYAESITVDPGGSGGTIFVRTADDRFAKLAFATPLTTMRGSIPASGLGERAAWALPLPFAYNPFPGRTLAYDPDEPSGAVDRAVAGAAAELPATGESSRGPRSYLLNVLDSAGAIVDSVRVRLVPGVPISVGDVAHAGYRYGNVTLRYGDDGLPGIRLSIESRTAVYHTADITPNSRFAVSREFRDFSTDYKPLRRTLEVIEVP